MVCISGHAQRVFHFADEYFLLGMAMKLYSSTPEYLKVNIKNVWTLGSRLLRSHLSLSATGPTIVASFITRDLLCN